jgi:hypothetical protein
VTSSQEGAGRVAFVSADTLRRVDAWLTGAAQDMVAHNLGMAAIQQAGGWKSPRMPARYGEQLEAKRSGAAILARIQGR